MAQLNLGAPSLVGKAVLQEALSVFGSTFPLTLFVTNQTLDSQAFASVEIPYNSTVSVGFETADALENWARKANQIGILHDFESSFIVSDEDPDTVVTKKAKKTKQADSATESTDSTATESTTEA
jgi:hypothetical protein